MCDIGYLSPGTIVGDPHIVTIEGKRYLMRNLEGVFSIFENDEIRIRGEFWKPFANSGSERDNDRADEEDALDQSDATYLKKIGVTVGSTSYVLDVYDFCVKQAVYDDEKNAFCHVERDPPIHDVIRIYVENCDKDKSHMIHETQNTISDHKIDADDKLERTIRLEYDDFYLEATDFRHVPTIQNQIQMNVEYLRESHSRSPASGLLVSDVPENYEPFYTIHGLRVPDKI